MKSKARVLVADDDKAIREVYSKILRKAGYEVSLATDGLEAIDIVRREHFDVAVVDIKMPRADGIEALKHIKQIDKDIEIILVTGFAALDTAIDAVKGDACDYLTKPLEDIEDLTSAVQRALHKQKLLKTQKQRIMFDRLPVLAEDGDVLFLRIEDVYYSDAVGHRARIHSFDRQYVTDFSLGELEKHLEGKLFLRVHRSYLVNLQNVAKAVTSEPQKVYLILADAKESKIPVSRSKVGHLRQVFGRMPPSHSPSQS